MCYQIDNGQIDIFFAKQEISEIVRKNLAAFTRSIKRPNAMKSFAVLL